MSPDELNAMASHQTGFTEENSKYHRDIVKRKQSRNEVPQDIQSMVLVSQVLTTKMIGMENIRI